MAARQLPVAIMLHKYGHESMKLNSSDAPIVYDMGPHFKGEAIWEVSSCIVLGRARNPKCQMLVEMAEEESVHLSPPLTSFSWMVNA